MKSFIRMKKLKIIYYSLSNNKKYLLLTYSIVLLDGIFSLLFIPEILKIIGEDNFGYWLYLFTIANMFLALDGGLSGYFLSKLRSDNDLLTKNLIYSVIKYSKFLILPILIILIIVSKFSGSIHYFLIIELTIIIYLQITNNLYDSLMVGQKKEVKSKLIVLLSSLFSVLVLILLIFFDYNSIDIISLSILARFIFSNLCYVFIFKSNASSNLDISNFKKHFTENLYEGYKLGLRNKFLSAFNSQGYIIIIGFIGNVILLANINLISRFINIVSTVTERLNPFILQILIDKKKSNSLLSHKILIIMNVFLVIMIFFLSYANYVFLDLWLPEKSFQYNLIFYVTFFILSGIISNMSSYMLLSLNDFVFSSKVIQIELYTKIICLVFLFIDYKFYFCIMSILSFVFFNYYLIKRNSYIETIINTTR